VNIHHLGSDITSFIAGYPGGIEVICVHEERLLGTAGGVRNALPHLEPGPFLIVYGDVLINESLRPLLALHQTSGAVATLAVHGAHSAEGKGVVDVDEVGRVRGFLEKGLHVNEPVLINSGIYVVETELVAALPAGQFSDFGIDVFPQALQSGLPIFASRLASPVVDIGTPEGLSLARSMVGAPATDAGTWRLTS
jgi:mannose-1-phosphate guanylyltransferase